MNVERCCGGRRSPASTALRLVMSKFIAFGENASGPEVFTGEQAPPLTAEEEKYQKQILGECDVISAEEGDRILQQLDPDVPFQNRLQFCEALAAIAVVHHEDMDRKGHKGRPVRKLLAAVLEPSKCAWYFNNCAHRCSVQLSNSALLASGTTSNEALHNELKQAFRQTTRMHQATLATKLAVINLGKLIVHVVAYLRHTTRQMKPGLIKARVLAKEAFSEEAWLQICERRSDFRPVSKFVSKLMRWRSGNVNRVKTWLLEKQEPAVERRKRKRTVFTLARRDSSGPSSLVQ